MDVAAPGASGPRAQRPGAATDSGAAARSWTERLGRALAYGLGIAGLLLLALGVVASYFLMPVAESQEAVGQIVSVPAGSTTRDISQILADEGVIRSAVSFHVLARALDADGRLQAGDYELSPAMSPLAIINRMRQGDVILHRVSIPEGYNLRQIAARLEDADLADAERFLALAQDANRVYGGRPPVDLPIVSLEGYLFPDTYRFPRDATEEEIIRRMVDRYLRTAAPVLEGTAAPMDLTPHEVMTLASIVEREAMVDRERPRIAGVFFNRLERGQPLQADPTVQYVMDEPRSRVLYRDLTIDSPYNTYRYRGLPPGPIASPGMASIRAVLEPEDTEYLYFVARGDGTHVFSRTFAEHVAARQRLGR